MLPPAGASEAERWVAAGRRACAQDLILRLSAVDKIKSVIALVAEEEDRDCLRRLGAEVRISTGSTFQFGAALRELITTEGIHELAYFGGASAPLLEQATMAGLIDDVLSKDEPFGIVNNLHSTDWLLINDAELIVAHSHRLPSDNPLGWVLSREAGVSIEATEPSAATRLDIDTPTDLFMAWRHHALGDALGEFLKELPPEITDKMEAIRKIIATPASTMTVIGRASAHVWQSLVASTQIWVRLFVEERGMVASHRLARGEVHSLIGQMLDELGPGEFVDRLENMAQTVLWDTRVWMGTRPEWPSSADRFAADLGWVDAIQDARLAELTDEIRNSSIPILAGGYGVVGGGLYALIESLRSV